MHSRAQLSHQTPTSEVRQPLAPRNKHRSESNSGPRKAAAEFSLPLKEREGSLGLDSWKGHVVRVGTDGRQSTTNCDQASVKLMKTVCGRALAVSRLPSFFSVVISSLPSVRELREHFLVHCHARQSVTQRYCPCRHRQPARERGSLGSLTRLPPSRQNKTLATLYF